MIVSILSIVVSPLTFLLRIASALINTTLFLSLAISCVVATLHKLGILQKTMHKMAEKQLSKEFNNARVTLGYLEYDFFRCQVNMRDAVIHTPGRQAWKWDSPLIARIGQLNASFSLMSLVNFTSKFLGYPCKDIYSVEVSDVQIFVEKRANVFNFHLLDPSLDLPDPDVALSAMASTMADNLANVDILEGGEGIESRVVHASDDSFGSVSDGSSTCTDSVTAAPDSASTPSLANGITRSRNNSQSSLATRKKSSVSSGSAETKANEIFNSMLGAVSSLGKAHHEGGKEGLNRAFRNQKEGFVSQLKKFRDNLDGPSTKSEGGFSEGNSVKMKQVALESMKVMKHIGKTVEKEIKEQVGTFKVSIPKKKGWVKKVNNDQFRFGRIVLQDVRIFTKDMILKRKSSEANASEKAKVEGWSKPILLKLVAISGSELSPSAMKDDNGLPSIGRTIDKIVDAVMKRVLAEMAKTNTGRLLQNTLGEVFAWMDMKSNFGKQKVR